MSVVSCIGRFVETLLTRRTVIRIYDIDIIHKDFWRSVAAQLHNRDPEYCKRSESHDRTHGTPADSACFRCTARPPNHRELSVIGPLCFDRESSKTNGTRSMDTTDAPIKDTEQFLEVNH